MGQTPPPPFDKNLVQHFISPTYFLILFTYSSLLLVLNILSHLFNIHTTSLSLLIQLPFWPSCYFHKNTWHHHKSIQLFSLLFAADLFKKSKRLLCFRLSHSACIQPLHRSYCSSGENPSRVFLLTSDLILNNA